jgi:hypothetical protein
MCQNPPDDRHELIVGRIVAEWYLTVVCQFSPGDDKVVVMSDHARGEASLKDAGCRSDIKRNLPTATGQTAARQKQLESRGHECDA